MTETPNGPHDPQQNDSSSPQPGRPPYAGSEWRRPDAPVTPPAVGSAQPDATPEFGATAEAGRREFGATPQAGGPEFGVTPTTGAPEFGATPAAGAPGFGAAAQGGNPEFGAAAQARGPEFGATPPASGATPPPGAPRFGPPVGAPQFGQDREAPTQQFGAPYGSPQYYSPQYGATNAAGWPYATPAPKKARGKRLIAIGAATAVFGGLVGGGTVAVLDRGNDTVAASGITIQGSSAPAAANQTASVESAAATAMKSVVTLSVRGSQEAGTGSGIVLRADGYILTNEHVTAVADGGGSITVAFSDGRTATATLVGADKATDLAVVKVNLTGLTAATFADSDALQVGQTVVAVGSPLGLNGTVTEGIVSALHRPTSGASDNSAVIDAIQTDAAINPGNSGGALVDLAGRVVGINQSIATAGSSDGGFGQQGSSSGNIGIGFAIPSDTAARISQQLISTGKATHAQLGVQTQTATSADQLTAIGATIARVTSGSAADKAGLKAGDVVTKVDNRVIGQSDDLAATVRSYAPGSKVTLTVRRGTATQTITVTLGSDATQ
jgi:putative serine protease PepD